MDFGFWGEPLHQSQDTFHHCKEYVIEVAPSLSKILDCLLLEYEYSCLHHFLEYPLQLVIFLFPLK